MATQTIKYDVVGKAIVDRGGGCMTDTFAENAKDKQIAGNANCSGWRPDGPEDV